MHGNRYCFQKQWVTESLTFLFKTDFMIPYLILSLSIMLFSNLLCLNMKILGYWQISITVFWIKSEPGCCLCKCWLQKHVPHFVVVIYTWRNNVHSWNSFLYGQCYSKNIKARGSKKLKKGEREICDRKGVSQTRVD